MIGVTPMARLASVISALGFIPYFEKARWLDVVPEYNPFKYNSFPANAGRQTYDITRDLQQRLVRRGAEGRLAQFPPVLTFQSLVDATVSTPAIVANLYDRLPQNGSALVLFDFNRHARLDQFIQPAGSHADRDGCSRSGRGTIASRSSRMRAPTRSKSPPATWRRARRRRWTQPLGLEWPRDLFSLSHVALPFPQSDPVYGNLADEVAGRSRGARAAEPARRARGADRSRRRADARDVEPVLPVSGAALSAWVNAGQ